MCSALQIIIIWTRIIFINQSRLCSSSGFCFDGLTILNFILFILDYKKYSIINYSRGSYYIDIHMREIRSAWRCIRTLGIDCS